MDPWESRGKETWETLGPGLGWIVHSSPDPWYRFCVKVIDTWVAHKFLYIFNDNHLLYINIMMHDLLVLHAEQKEPNIIVLHSHTQDKFHHLFQLHCLEKLQYMAYPVQACFRCCNVNKLGKLTYEKGHQ